MGSALYKSLFPNEIAKVALLNIGSEEIKGTDILKKAHSNLKQISNNGDFVFNGYIEGNKITDGFSNVIVTDGFTGNIALKTAEGTAKFITDNLKVALKDSLLSKFSIFLLPRPSTNMKLIVFIELSYFFKRNLLSNLKTSSEHNLFTIVCIKSVMFGELRNSFLSIKKFYKRIPPMF